MSTRLGRKPEDIIKLDANENPYGPPPEVSTVACLHDDTLYRESWFTEELSNLFHKSITKSVARFMGSTEPFVGTLVIRNLNVLKFE